MTEYLFRKYNSKVGMHRLFVLHMEYFVSLNLIRHYAVFHYVQIFLLQLILSFNTYPSEKNY